MWLMLQQEKPDDYVIATGETHSVREFLEEAFKIAGIEIESNGKKGSEEEYIIADLAEIVSGVFKDKYDVEIAKSQIIDRPAERYVPSVQRAVSELGLKQFIGLKEAIMKTANALREGGEYKVLKVIR